MRRYRTISALVLASLAVLAGRQSGVADDKATQSRGQFSADDYKFACEAARGGILEVQAGDLARTQGASPTVRQFGERMVTDHTRAGNDLKAIASRRGATLPAALDRKDQRRLESLRKLTGRDFDVAYAKDMVEDHKEDLKLFQKAAQDATDADLKAFATTGSGMIEQHLEAAKQMETIAKNEVATR